MEDDEPRLGREGLNRALLARQGLLERLEGPLSGVVESVGALQAQSWPAPGVALASRVEGFELEDLYAGLERRELVVGTLLRGTIHLVSARTHPEHAVVAEASGAGDWRRTPAEPSPEVERLRADLLAHAATEPRTMEELAAFAEAWVAGNPGVIDEAEAAAQAALRWRPFLRWGALVRAPADGRRGAKTPAARVAAPAPHGPGPAVEDALGALVRSHLRAFGPAAAEDVAYWIGWRTPSVREALERLEPELVRFEDEDGRALHDLPDAPRPHPAVPAPPRLLAAFDSVLLAYAPGRRDRILPAAHRDAVFMRANLQVLPTFLVGGFVAGLWSTEIRRREATTTLRPFARLARADHAALVEEADRLVRVTHPGARAYRVTVER